MNRVETDAEKIARLEHDLAECFKLTGADSDGDEDWRLAPRAVEEVKRMREAWDATEDTLIELQSKFDALYPW